MIQRKRHPYARGTRVESVCATCGKVQKVLPCNVRTYCSRSCAGVAFRAVRTRMCIGCGAQFTAKRSDANYCTKLCGTRAYGRQLARSNGPYRRRALAGKLWRQSSPLTAREQFERRQLKLYGPIRARACSVCSRDFLPKHRGKSICSSRCARRARKGARSGAYSKRENRVAIFQRDRWRCVACGVETPAALMGSVHECAPEIDHWVPVALGGPDARWNAHTLCRTCNAVKRDVVLPVPTQFLRRLQRDDYAALVACWQSVCIDVAGSLREQRGMRVHRKLRARYAHVYTGRHNPWRP